MTASEPLPARAPVRPRVRRQGSSLPRLLEEEIAELLAAGKRVDVRLVSQGSGDITSALQHLAAVFEGEPRLWLGKAIQGAIPAEVVVRVRRYHDHQTGSSHDFELLPWTEDEVLEYLLATHRDRIGPTFAAWSTGPAHDLRKRPQLCRRVLDTLAANPALGEPLTALSLVLRQGLGASYPAMADRALRLYVPQPTSRDSKNAALERLLRTEMHEMVGGGTALGLLAAQRLLELAVQQRGRLRIELRWLPALRTGIDHALRTDPDLTATLRQLANGPRLRHKALVLGSLSIREPGFRPTRSLRGDLRRAFLHGIDLSGLGVRARMPHAELDRALLRDTHFDRCDLECASLRDARAERSQWSRVHAPNLQAAGLQAPQSRWTEAMLRLADFRSACLDEAQLLGANLNDANLQGVSLARADLRGAQLDGARLAFANLQDANCDGAHFAAVDLRTTRLAGASCSGTWFNRCDLSATDLPGLLAPKARFDGCDLTATRWRGAQLDGASFAAAGLADIDWEGADLRGCDLRHATFHLGNSRSGLVDSTIASEGSRTGFYTDESLEHQFQAPEDVRKANLRGCDLRGAQLEGADFYLVDVRGARLDPGQRGWLKRCRAILDRDVT